MNIGSDGLSQASYIYFSKTARSLAVRVFETLNFSSVLKPHRIFWSDHSRILANK